MQNARPNLIVAAAVLVLLSMSFLQAAQPAGDFAARLDDVAGKLAAYDFGGDNAPLNALTDLINATQKEPEQRKVLAQRLAAVLTSNAPRGAKDFACRQLSVIGSAEHVPALAGLLTDEQLSHMGRYALERIPGPAADEALRQALGKVQGKLLVGVINSLGSRRDAAAVGDLAKLVSHADAQVAAAAAAALGKIGPPAAQPLSQTLAGATPAMRSGVAEANLLCADQLVAQGQREAAVAIYDRVRGAEVPKAIRVAATRGAILARQAGGVPLLVEQLKSTDAGLFGLGLSVVRELPGAEVTKTIAEELAKLPPPQQVAVVLALADRRDPAAAPAVLRLAHAGDAAVRPAALQALSKLGDATLVPALLELAAGQDADAARAALGTLTSLPGKPVDAALLATVDKGDVKSRRVVIEVLGLRRVTEAAAALLKAAQDGDPAIRAAAVKAAGETASAQDLGALVALLVQAKEAPDRSAVEPALAATCQRLADREATAATLAAAVGPAGVEAQVALLRLLGQVGGVKALAAVQERSKDANEGVRDTAVRVLADWQDGAAADALLNLAKSAENPKNKLLALRGYIRLIGARDVAGDRKLAMAKDALGLADRDDEKRLILGALGGVHSAPALALVVPSLDNPALKNEASAAAVSIGERIAASHPADVAASMKKVVAVTENKDLQKKAQELLTKTDKK